MATQVVWFDNLSARQRKALGYAVWFVFFCGVSFGLSLAAIF